VSLTAASRDRTRDIPDHGQPADIIALTASRVASQAAPRAARARTDAFPKRFPSVSHAFPEPFLVTSTSTNPPFRIGPFLLGWAFPGLGHILSGNARRGVYAMSGVLLLFVTGVAVGGIDCVDRKEDWAWFIGQAGAGPIAFAVSYANDALLKTGSVAPMLEAPSFPSAARVTVSAFKGVGHANDFGTLLVCFAGLMNICVMLDAAVRAPASDAPTSGRRAGDSGRPATGAPATEAPEQTGGAS